MPFQRELNLGYFKLTILFTAWLLMTVRSHAAEPASNLRAPWTTSKVAGSPDAPPPFKVVRTWGRRVGPDHPKPHERIGVRTD